MKELIKTMEDMLPDYIDEAYPKGVREDRGIATVSICLYLNWLKKQLKD